MLYIYHEHFVNVNKGLSINERKLLKKVHNDVSNKYNLNKSNEFYGKLYGKFYGPITALPK